MNNEQKTNILVRLGSDADLWHTPGERPFATVEVQATHRNLEINSSTYRNWLRRMFWETQGTAANKSALNDAIEVLTAKAVFDGPEHEAHLRLARADGNIYLDLGGPGWHVIEISPKGWRPVLDPPVRFYRSRGMQALPWPQAGGSVEDLRPFVNVRSERDFILAVAWLLGALNPDGPFPIALIQGQQGSAKSTLARVLRSLVDPSDPAQSPKPRSERDFAIAARNSWVMAFDNLSKVSAEFSDALCRMATGTGFRTRKLYTDTEEIILQLCRPQILNGIEDLATRDDLRDRGILFELPVIPSDERKRERTFWKDFEDAQPRILGALLRAVSTALRREGSVDLPDLPRMADFAAWVISGEQSLPWAEGAFLHSYEENRRDAISIVLDHSPLAQRIMVFSEQKPEWDGTPTELHNALVHVTGAQGDPPATPASMSQELKRLAPALRQVGVELEWNRENDHKRTRKIVVRAVPAVQAPGEDTEPEDNDRATTTSTEGEV